MIANLIVKVTSWHHAEHDDLCRDTHGSTAADVRMCPMCLRSAAS